MTATRLQIVGRREVAACAGDAIARRERHHGWSYFVKCSNTPFHSGGGGEAIRVWQRSL